MKFLVYIFSVSQFHHMIANHRDHFKISLRRNIDLCYLDIQNGSLNNEIGSCSYII